MISLPSRQFYDLCLARLYNTQYSQQRTFLRLILLDDDLCSLRSPRPLRVTCFLFPMHTLRPHLSFVPVCHVLILYLFLFWVEYKGFRK